MVSETIIEVQFSFDYIIQKEKFIIEPSLVSSCYDFLSWKHMQAPISQRSMQFSYYERVFSNGNWCHWLCCMNKNTLRMTFTVWRATYFETEVYMQVCIQNYILSPLFIRVKIDFNLTLTQSFDLIMWFLERIPLMESSTVMNLSVMSHDRKIHKLICQTLHPTKVIHKQIIFSLNYQLSWRPLVMTWVGQIAVWARAKKLVWRKSRPKQKLGLNPWKPNSMIFRYF